MRFTKLMLTASAIAITGLLATACSGADTTGADSTGTHTDVVTINVAASATPMTDAVNAASEAIEDGYEVELVETTGYFTPNVLLKDGEVDANFIQHPPHMEDFNEGNDANLVVVQPIYYVIGGFYSRELTSLADLEDGAKVSIPSDSNQGRALELLADEGIITLADDAGRFEATLDDVEDNPKNLSFIAVDLANANVSHDEADVTYLLASFARQLELFPETDALVTDQDERFAVSLVARDDNVDSDAIQALKRAFTSDEVRETLEGFDQPVAF